MAHRPLALVALVAVSVSTTAHADWGSTRWGWHLLAVEQSVDGVQRYGGDQALGLEPGVNTAAHLPGYQAAGSTFDVRFAFDLNYGGLVAVTLVGSGRIFKQAQQQLTKRYGRSVGPGAHWTDQADNLDVTLRGGPDQTIIRYMAVPAGL